jgi:hypothetical protein
MNEPNITVGKVCVFDYYCYFQERAIIKPPPDYTVVGLLLQIKQFNPRVVYKILVLIDTESNSFYRHNPGEVMMLDSAKTVVKEL